MPKRSNAGKFLKLLLVVPTVLSMASTLLSFAREELILMKRKMVFLVFLTLISFIFLITTWLSLCGLLLFYLLAMNVSIMLALITIMVINLILLLVSGLILACIKVNPTLPETRNVISDIISQ